MKLLILSRANAARGPMAEGLARQMFGSSLTVVSAGLMPTALNQYAVATMQEINVDISRHVPLPMTQLNADDFDLILTINERDLSSGLAAKGKRVHWPIPDPLVPPASGAELIARMRDARTAISKHLHGLSGIIQLVKSP